ncbi:siderophore-iron reductase FhuF [Acidovorax sp. NCPPB 2350]|nr:siderophore-iron reductase FhuF [Acidovorax sp. NCPPB 2350]
MTDPLHTGNGNALAGSMRIFETLDAFFSGALVECAQTFILSPSPPPDSIALWRVLEEPQVLRDLLERNHAHLRAKGTDLRASASMWSMRYCWVVLPYAMVAATLLRQILPITPRETWVQFDDQGQPLRFVVSTAGMAASGEASTQQRYAPLVFGHLQPLVEAIHALTRLSRRILWVNVVRHVQAIFDHGLQDQALAPAISMERRMLLETPRWDTPGTLFQKPCENPLFHPPRSVHLQGEGGVHRTIQVHRSCCLFYLVDEPRYCSACPLDPENIPSRKAQCNL